MSPSLNSVVVSLADVPGEDLKVGRERRQPVILIVDDEPLVADTLAVILSRAGFATMTAYDGKTALKLAGNVPPELLISDVAMEEMNGIELAMAMVHALPECKVLLFSGHATNADLADARAAGYSFPLLSKPVHPAVMLRHIAACLSAPEAMMEMVQ
jgi:DNA-binding NtrC family response regulator